MMWCTTERSVGRASAIPDAGTAKALGNSKILSGLGMPQPSTKFAGGGASLGSPSGAPAFAHVTNVLISLAVNARSFAKCPYAGSAYQGGIIFCCTTSLMLEAHGRAC